MTSKIAGLRKTRPYEDFNGFLRLVGRFYEADAANPGGQSLPLPPRLVSVKLR